MKTKDIVIEEFKKAGLEVAEEAVEVVIKTVFEKVLPRLALEAEEATVKSVAAFATPFAGMVEKELLGLADGIDGKKD